MKWSFVIMRVSNALIIVLMFAVAVHSTGGVVNTYPYWSTDDQNAPIFVAAGKDDKAWKKKKIMINVQIQALNPTGPNLRLENLGNSHMILAGNV